MRKDPLLSIGTVANRCGLAVSALRFYADENLVPTVRSSAGHRLFHRSTIRRVSFIMIAQSLGYSLPQIRSMLDKLPEKRTPTKNDWRKLALAMQSDIDNQIQKLKRFHSSLDQCIGCGCLSLSNCLLYNSEDKIASKGAGARYFLGDKPSRD